MTRPIYKELSPPLRTAFRFAQKCLRAIAPVAAAKAGFFARFGRWPDFDKPELFNEFLARRAALLDEPMIELFSDKLAARRYAADLLGEAIAPRLFGAFESPEDVLSLRLATPVVAKPNHLSGEVVFYDRIGAEEAKDLSRRFARWRKMSLVGRRGERWYRNARPWLVVEQDIRSDRNADLDDIKVFCFAGRALLVEVHRGRFTNHTVSTYSLDWQPIPINYGYEPAEPLARPDDLDRLVAIAETLSRETPFVRVDLYEVAGKIYFGELTPMPHGGNAPVTPPEGDLALGCAWRRALGMPTSSAQEDAAASFGLSCDHILPMKHRSG